jgi:hypothetical protein
LLGLASPAWAGLIPVNVSIHPDSGNYRWTYAVIVTTDVRVNPGDSFTIYDVHGMLHGSAAMPANWSVAEALTTTPHPGTLPFDDPTVPNITFTYNGLTPIDGQAGLGNFSIISVYSDAATGDFTSSAHRQVDGRVEYNITTTDVPAPPDDPGGGVNETPEPSTFALLGMGIPLAALARRRRRRLA